MKFYPLLFLIFLFAACSGAPDQETVQQVRENQPKRAQPLENASTDYPQELKDLGLEMPGKTAVFESGLMTGPEMTAEVLSVKMLTSLSLKNTYKFYQKQLAKLDGFTLNVDRLVEDSQEPSRDRFQFSAVRDSSASLSLLGNKAYGAPDKIQIIINYAQLPEQ
jgi:hypothetical protein